MRRSTLWEQDGCGYVAPAPVPDRDEVQSVTAATVRAAVAMPSFGGVGLTLCCLLLSLPNSQEKSGRLEKFPKGGIKVFAFLKTRVF